MYYCTCTDTYVEYVHTLSVLIQNIIHNEDYTLSVLIQNTCMYNEYIIYIIKIRFMVIRRIKEA